MSLFNRYTQIPRNNPESEEQISDEGLSARLAIFAAENPPEELKEATPPVEDSPNPEDAPTAETPPDNPPPKEDNEEEEDEEFPEIGAPAKAENEENEEDKVDEFDEAEFDSQTAAILKKLEEKGHPGDVYKDLRSQLKEAKASLANKTPIADPQVDDLKRQIEELKNKEEELEGLRQRNQELLRLNDETAIRESEEFKNAIDKPLAKMETDIADLAKQFNLEDKELFDIILENDLAKQDSLLEKIEHKIGRRATLRLERAAEEFRMIHAKRSDMFRDAQKTIAETRRSEEQRIAQERKQELEEFQRNARASFEQYAERIPGFTDSNGFLSETAKSIQAKVVAIDPSTLSAQDLGYMAFAAQSLPALRKALVALEKENTLLKSGKEKAKPLEKSKSTPAGENEPIESGGLMAAMAGKNFTFAGT